MKKEITLPGSWEAVTIGQYESISEILSEECDIKDRTVKLISLLTDLERKEILGLDINEFNKITAALSFIKEKVPNRIPNETTVLDGKKYNVSLYPQKWVASQFLDYESIIGNESLMKTARLIACFVVPEGHSYNDGYDVESVVKSINDSMSLPEGLSYLNFFTIQYVSFAKAFLRYSARKVKRLTRIPKQERKMMMDQLKMQERNLDLLLPTGNS